MFILEKTENIVAFLSSPQKALLLFLSLKDIYC